MINMNRIKKLLKPEYVIILIIILTIIYFISSPFRFYKGGELYRTEFTRIKSAEVSIVNRNNPSEYFIAHEASRGFYAEFHSFDGTIQSIHEISGTAIKNIKRSFSTSLWVGDTAYFSGLRTPEELVIWEVDFNTKKVQGHFVKNLNILRSLQDTMIVKNGVTFHKPKKIHKTMKKLICILMGKDTGYYSQSQWGIQFILILM